MHINRFNVLYHKECSYNFLRSNHIAHPSLGEGATTINVRTLKVARKLIQTGGYHVVHLSLHHNMDKAHQYSNSLYI